MNCRDCVHFRKIEAYIDTVDTWAREECRLYLKDYGIIGTCEFPLPTWLLDKGNPFICTNPMPEQFDSCRVPFSLPWAMEYRIFHIDKMDERGAKETCPTFCEKLNWGGANCSDGEKP